VLARVDACSLALPLHPQGIKNMVVLSAAVGYMLTPSRFLAVRATGAALFAGIGAVMKVRALPKLCCTLWACLSADLSALARHRPAALFPVPRVCASIL
jgi:hypothetical protein